MDWKGNSKAKDNSFKAIFKIPELFIEFIQDYVKNDQLSGLFDSLKPSDIEDMTERLLPLFQDEKDNDTIQRINLKGDVPLFVIAVLEHESKVNYRTSFKMLQYIALVLHEYEKEENSKKNGASSRKNFKYPPVLPIVFYDGSDNWTAEMNFVDKTKMRDVFYKYIPKFEYELVRLRDYSQDDIMKFGNTLSVIMLIDSVRSASDMKKLKDLPEGFITQLGLNVPQSLAKLIADVITVLLKRMNVPGDEIDAVSEAIYQRRYQEMFSFIQGYDVQETRRKGREEGLEKGLEKGKYAKAVEVAGNLLNMGMPVEQIAQATGLSAEELRILAVQ